MIRICSFKLNHESFYTASRRYRFRGGGISLHKLQLASDMALIWPPEADPNRQQGGEKAYKRRPEHLFWTSCLSWFFGASCLQFITLPPAGRRYTQYFHSKTSTWLITFHLNLTSFSQWMKGSVTRCLTFTRFLFHVSCRSLNSLWLWCLSVGNREHTRLFTETEMKLWLRQPNVALATNNYFNKMVDYSFIYLINPPEKR